MTVAVQCIHCARSCPPGSRFCVGCGHPLMSPPRERRAVVTVLFADVADVVALGDRIGPDALRQATSDVFTAMRAVAEAHGGAVEKYVGDSVVVTFGSHVAREDDALRAVRASVELAPALEELNAKHADMWGAPLTVRIGINTGEVVVGADDPALGTGDAVNVAARLHQAAEPGEILLGASTWALVAGAVDAEEVAPLALRGRGRVESAYRLRAVRPEPRSVSSVDPGALVGRDQELAVLVDAYERCVRTRTTHRVVVIGDAGIGKSRLVGEFVRRCAAADRVLVARCLAYGRGITYWPITEMLRQAAHLATDAPIADVAAAIHLLLAAEPDSADVNRALMSLILASAAAPAQEVAWGLRRGLEVLGRRGPIVAVIEDAHWAEPALFDLVEHVTEFAVDTPLLLLVTGRPEVADRRPRWRATTRSTWLALEPLVADDAARLVDDRLGAAADDVVRHRIVELAEGNPLYVEQVVSMLVDQGTLVHADGTWRFDDASGELGVPPTIQAILASRLGRLDDGAHDVVDAAAVIGTRFARGALAALLPTVPAERLDEHLATLRVRELVAPQPLGGDTELRFRHGLIRDQAYLSIPKTRRATLHESYAGWLAATSGERISEFDEIVGFHLEQAVRARSSLASATPSDALADEAATRLASGARRAVEREDFAAASSLLGRAVALLPPGAPARPQLLPALGSALLHAGDLDQAARVVAEAGALARESGDTRLTAHVLLLDVQIALERDPEGAADRARREARRLAATFEGLGDDLSLARCWRVQAEAHHMRCHAAAAEDAFEHALRHAERAGDEWEAVGAHVGLLMMARRGPKPVPEALRRSREIADRVAHRRTAQVTAYATIGALEAMAGRLDEARSLAARAGEVFRDLGLVGWSGQAPAYVEMLAGDFSAAEALLRVGYEDLHRRSRQGYLATQAAQLGVVLLELGRWDEADQMAGAARSVAAIDDVDAQVGWRQVRAQVLAARADGESALSTARAAVAIAATTDHLNLIGDTRLSYARVLRAVGKESEAQLAFDQALESFTAKGNAVMAARVEAVRNR